MSEQVIEELNDTTVNATDGGTSVSANMNEAVDPMDVQKLEMPEKFANAEDPQQALMKAYIELEKMKGGAPNVEVGQEDKGSEAEGTETPNDVGDLPVDSSTSTTVDVDGSTDSDVVEANDADVVADYSKLWADQGGKLEDAQWAEVAEKSGVTVDEAKAYGEWKAQQQVDPLIQEAIAKSDTEVFEAVGGQEQYDAMAKWANEKLGNDQALAIEAMLSKPELAKQGALTLRTMYENRDTIEPSVTKDGQATPAVQGFNNDAEYMEALQNPLYKTSPKYRNSVDVKLIAMMKKNGTLKG
jgi:hypothetical protein